jgi:hypothetical protein
VATNSAVFDYSDGVSKAWARGTHALIAVVCLAFAVVGLTVLSVYLYQEHEHQRPLFFVVGEFGEVHGKSYQVVQFDRSDPRFERAHVIQSFLGKFVRLQFQFRKKSAADDLPEALYFMAADKAKPYETAYRDGYITKRLRDPSEPEVLVSVENIDLAPVGLCGGPKQPACSAQIQYTKTVESEAQPCMADIQFGFAEGVRTFEEMEENPLGIAVEEFSSQCGAAKTVAKTGF